jgi:hypothetical protein
MKENTKKYVKLSIILYIVILSVALVGTLAWFVFKQSATITTEKNSKIVAGEYLEICFDDGKDEWGTDMKLASVLQLPDVSLSLDADNKAQIWYPTSLDENDQLFFDELGKEGKVYLDVTDKDGYFIKLNLKVRASKKVDVYLHSSSTVSCADDKKTDALNSFSKDAIAGAARVAFFDEGGLKTIWVPNEKFELVSEGGKVTEFKFDGNPEESYNYLKVVDETVKSADPYGIWNPDTQLTVGKNELADDNNVNDATPLLSFDDAGEQKLTVYIWVEGTDREANTVLSGGSLKFDLKLVAVDQKADSTFNIDDVDCDGSKLFYKSSGAEVGSEILYSRDSITWTPYSTGAPLFNESEILYVRAAETETEKWSSIKEFKSK